MKKNLFLIALLIVLIIIAVGLSSITNNRPFSGQNGNSNSGGFVPTSSTTTFSGVFVCLPHRNTEGPQTQECLYGMKTDDGKYVATDFSSTSISAFDLPMNTRYSITGLYTPIEAISNDFWFKYNVIGIMKVSSYQEVISEIPKYSASSTVIMELKKPIIVASTTIRINAVTEDSRCPSDVNCFQAGKASVMMVIDSPSGSSVLQLNERATATTETLSIRLDKVEPYPVSTRKITDEEYRFTVTIKNK